MTPRETVLRAFSFQATEIVPYSIPMEDEVAARLDAYYGTPVWRSRLVPFVAAWHVAAPLTPLGNGICADAFGTIIRQGNISHIEKTALSRPSLNGYEWPDPADMEDWDALKARCEAITDSFRMCGMGWGLYERSWLMRGFENILMDMVERPSFVDDLLDGILKVHLKTIDIIASRIPIEAYFGGDDFSDQRGPIMGPELWRRFFKPRYAELIAHSHSLGLPFVLHSCGNVLPLVDDLMEIGLDGLESLQPEAMDVYELKRKAAGKMVLMGGMGMQSTMAFGSPDDVRAETRRLIAELGRGGGYILAPAKPLMHDVPTENAAAFVETAVQNPRWKESLG